MTPTTDYSQLTLEALLQEEKKVKSNQLIAGLATGFLVGIMLFGVWRNGFGFLYLAIPLFLIVMIVRNAKLQKQNLALIQNAIAAKRSS